MEERAMRLGATAYLRKPFDDEALLGAIGIAMKHLSNSQTDESEGDRTG
jgi:FixJ family two-component response regulator